MIESSNRVEEFQTEVAELRIVDPDVARERILFKLGAALLIIGPAVAALAYPLAAAGNSLEQRQAIVQGLIGVALAITGAALFLRYSLSHFLRYWMTRLTYEQKAQTDRLLGVATAEAPDGLDAPGVVVPGQNLPGQ